LTPTLASITRAVVEVLPQVQYGSITMRHRDGTLDTHAPTETLLNDLDQQQYQLHEGPCYDATTDTLYALAGDLGSDERYPRYGPLAVRAGFRSQGGIRLFENNRTAGGLNLYGDQVDAMDQVQTLSRLFSDQAALALAYSVEVTTLREAVQSGAGLVRRSEW
jgi:hypothetical protein